MEPLYAEELRSAVSLLMANLESLPVTRGGGADLRHQLKRSVNIPFLELGDEGDALSKSDVVLSFTLEVNSHPTRLNSNTFPEWSITQWKPGDGL